MERLISDEHERKRLGDHAASVTARFSVDKVVRMWEEVLEDTKRSMRDKGNCAVI